MQVAWFAKAQTEEEKETIKRAFSSSAFLLDVLRGIISSKLKQNMNKGDYQNPSWAYYQADQNGYNRALTEMLTILENK